MMRPGTVSLALAFGAIFGVGFVAAQSANQPQGQAANIQIVQLPPVNAACPVSMRAQQVAGGGLITTGASHPKYISQGLHLILANPGSRQITGARFTVHGLTPKPRIVQVLAEQDGSDKEMTFDVSFSAGPEKDVSADLRVSGLSAVNYVDLESVSYSDGSTWKLEAGNTCRVAPRVMLIGGR